MCKQNITWAKLIVGDDTGYWNLAGGTTFNVDHPILYPSSNGTAGYYLSNVYLCYPTISLRTVTEETRKLPPQLYMPMRVRGASDSRFLSANCETNLPLQ